MQELAPNAATKLTIAKDYDTESKSLIIKANVESNDIVKSITTIKPLKAQPMLTKLTEWQCNVLVQG